MKCDATLQISGFVSGLVVIACFAKFLFKKPLINIVISSVWRFIFYAWVVCQRWKEKISATALQQQTRFFVYHRQTQERINMLWNVGQFSLLFWKIYSWLSKQIALTGSCRFTTTESQYYSLCYTAPLYRKIFIPLNLYIRQILSYLKQNESYLFETIFGLLPLSISLNRRSVVQKCQLSLSVLPWTLLALNGFSPS